MANIRNSMFLLADLEHSGKEDQVLHKNQFENGLTFWGIYEKENPNWDGWIVVKQVLKETKDIKEASKKLFKNPYLFELVMKFYKKEFWDKMQLDLVNSQKIADEMFIFGVNVHWKVSVKKAQKLVGAKPDGFVGNETIRLLNAYDVNKFDVEFDELEKQYYADVIKAKPYLVKYKKGWDKRAVYVFLDNQNNFMVA